MMSEPSPPQKKFMNEELVCNLKHMLATAVFYYTLSNMRNLGLAIWQTTHSALTAAEEPH